MKFSFLNNETLPRKVKKLFSPRRTFSHHAKGRFLATFDAAHGHAAVHDGAAREGALRGARSAHSSRIAFVFKMIAVSVAGVAVLVGGFSAYADTTNAPIESPLYPLKRLAENVQLAVTPAAAKPELEATLAARRAGEITDLETKHPSSTLIAKLTADLTTDVTASIGGALQEDQTAPEGHIPPPQATPQNGNGGEHQNGNGNNGENNGSHRFHTMFGTSTTSTASSTASTTISAAVTSTASSSVSEENDGQGHNRGRGEGQDNGQKKNTLINVCDTLRPIFDASSSLSEDILGRFRDITHFEAQCGLAASSTSESSPNATPMPTLTPTPSPTATATPAPTSTEHEFMPYRLYHDASSTEDATTSLSTHLDF